MPILLILGATSDIARTVALRFAREGWDLQLAGRNMRALEAIANDMAVRTKCEATVHHFDGLHPEEHRAFWEQLPVRPDAVLCAVGFLGKQKEAETDFGQAAEILQSNFIGLTTILGLVANEFEARQSGCIIGISSVAGDRGRASNYLYGSAKAGLTAFLSGLRNRLSRSGVYVLTVKPGFVRTAMTAGLQLPPALTAEPEEVGSAIWRAFNKKRCVIYVRPIWSLIMKIVILLPECIFKKMKF